MPMTEISTGTAANSVSSVAKTFVTLDANYREKVGVFLRGMTW